MGSLVSSLLRPAGEPPLLVGHRGIPVLAPDNTLRSFELALRNGADTVEVDVVALDSGTILAGHSLELAELCHGAARGHAGKRTLEQLRELDPELATLEQVLAFLAGTLDGRPFLLDLKSDLPLSRLVSLLRAAGLSEQALLCSLERRTLVQLRSLAPEIARSLSYPADRYRASERRVIAPLVPAALRVMRLVLESRLAAWLDQTGSSVVTLHHGVVTRALVERCHDREVAVIVWTVDDASLWRTVDTAGADAIISNDPRRSVH